MSKPVIESLVKVVLGLVAIVLAPAEYKATGVALVAVGLVELPFRF